jgi:hypothetical protein
MKASSPAAATALAALYAKDSHFVERCIDHLTSASLRELDRRLLEECSSSYEDSCAEVDEVTNLNTMIMTMKKSKKLNLMHLLVSWVRKS